MAQIDLKNVTIRLCDGRRATLSPASTPGNSRLTFTDADYHRGSRWQTVDPISIVIVASGTNTSLSVSVSAKVITIHLATDGGGAQTSTANQIITAYNLVSAAKALATIANFSGSTGSGITDPASSANLATGPRALVAKIGDGNLDWDETRSRVYLGDRGLLDAVKDGDQTPIDVRSAYAWQFLTAVSMSGTPTEEDVYYQRGEASTWVSTSPDDCEPYCIDIELENDIPCGSGTKKEFILFPMFRAEEFAHDPKTSLVTVSGKCNATDPLVYEF